MEFPVRFEKELSIAVMLPVELLMTIPSFPPLITLPETVNPSLMRRSSIEGTSEF